MKIQPEAHNACSIILDDGSEFKFHHAIHGEKDDLYVSCNGVVEIAAMNLPKLDWGIIGTDTTIRLTRQKNKQ